jgi:hypothetical protein
MRKELCKVEIYREVIREMYALYEFNGMKELEQLEKLSV